jgi:peptide/nickel transport system substrate-binding protein
MDLELKISTRLEAMANRRLAWVAACAAMTAGIATAAFLSPAVAQTPKKGGTLNFSVVAEPPTLDCHATTTFATLHPVRPHYNTLLKVVGDVNKKLEIKGDLADSWTMAPDGLTWTFKLFGNVKFHDGTPMTSADIKASYERIYNPAAGILSARKALHTDIGSIETPDATTVIFKMKVPNASMLNNFASPFNCIYSAKKLAENPKYPETEILGTGPFTYVDYVKGSSWEGKRFDGYFRAGQPYLDGYKAFFVKSAAVVPGIQGAQFDVEFRGRTPKEKEQLVEAMKDKATVMEGPWTTSLLLTFNTKKKPFDDVRVRQALSMAIDRWGGSTPLSKISMLKYVGGFTRPGSEWALPEAELAKLPGYDKDIAKSREAAKKLLADAGVKDLKIKLVNRNIAEPYRPGGIYVVDQWKRIGVETEHLELENRAYFDSQQKGEFDATLEFISDFIDDPSLQFVKFVPDSPANVSGAVDEKLKDLFAKQAVVVDPTERRKLTHEFERHAITQGYSTMLYWWQRIIVMNAKVKGWELHASHFTGQDLSDVWLDQ